MDLSRIAARLRTQAETNSSIVLDGTVLSDAQRADLRTAFALGADLAITNVPSSSVPVAFDGELTVTGGHATVLGVSVDIDLTIRPGGADDDPELIVAARMPAEWSWWDSFPWLPHFPFDVLDVYEATFVYVSQPQPMYAWPKDTAETINLAEEGLHMLGAIVPRVSTDFADIDIHGSRLNFHGPFSPRADQALPVGKLSTPLRSEPFRLGHDPFVVTVSKPQLAVVIADGTPEAPMQDVTLQVNAVLDDTLSASIGLSDDASSIAVVIAPSSETTVSVDNLLKMIPGIGEVPVPAELHHALDGVGLRHFSMLIDGPSVPFTRFVVGMTTTWTIIHDELELDDLRVEVTTQSGTKGVSVYGRAQLLPAAFPGEFFFHADIVGPPWQVDAIEGRYVGAVSLDQIVRGLPHAPNHVPESLKALTLDEFGVAVTGTAGERTYALFGTGDAAFPIFGTELTAQLAISAKKQQPAGYDVRLLGQLFVDEQAFALDLDLNEEGGRLLATWEDEGLPFGLDDIATEFGLDPPPIPEGLDLALVGAGLQYDFGADRLVFEAQSKHYGTAVFVALPPADSAAAESGRQYVFDLALSTTITLANLPLVGQQLPRAGDIGLQNLGFTYSSAALSGTDLQGINEALQALDVSSPFRGESLSPGFHLRADIMEGGKPTPIAIEPGPPKASPPSAPDGHTQDPPPDDAEVKWIPVGKTLGAVDLRRFGFKVTRERLKMLVDGGFSLGGLSMDVAGLGFETPLVRFDPTFSLDGLGLGYTSGPVTISGTLMRVDEDPAHPEITLRFDGAATVGASKFSLDALGSFAIVDGAPSIFVYAEVDGNFGGPPFFFITGIAAGFGFNSALRIPDEDEVTSFPLIGGVQGDDGKPPDPMTVLAVLGGRTGGKAWISPKTGSLWLAAGLTFQSFELLTTRAMLAIVLGEQFELSLLGRTQLVLPRSSDTGGEVTPIVDATLGLEVRFIPDKGVLKATARLDPASYVFDPDCHLHGGMALQLWFSGPKAGEFVFTVGGYHPSFHPPDWYPQEPRLGFSWQLTSEISIEGDAYCAITPSAVMAGGSLQARYHSGGLKAWFKAWADFLIQWKPFHYEIDIGVKVGASYTLNVIWSSTVRIELGASLHLEGQPFSGWVHIDWFIISFTISFGDSAPPKVEALTWDQFRESFLPKPDGRGAGGVLTASIIGGRLPGQAEIPAVDPDGLRLSASSAIPLLTAEVGTEAVNLDSGKPDGGEHRLGIKPMKAALDESTLTVRLQHEKGGDIPANRLKVTPQRMRVPTAMWDPHATATDKVSDLPAEATIGPVLTGVEVSIEHTDADLEQLTKTPPIDRSDLAYGSDDTVAAAAFGPREAAGSQHAGRGDYLERELERSAAARVQLAEQLQGMGFAIDPDEVREGRPAPWETLRGDPEHWTLARPSVVEVLAIDHATGAAGEYFHFRSAELDQMLGREDWNGETFTIKRGEAFIAVTVWRSPNGGSAGDAHGRKTPRNAAQQGDWKRFDRLLFGELLDRTVQVVSVDHASGFEGKYFNFRSADIDGIVGHENWHGLRFTIFQYRTGKLSTAVLWRQSNGGSEGDGHGRWWTDAAPNQWQRRERFEIRFAPFPVHGGSDV